LVAAPSPTRISAKQANRASRPILAVFLKIVVWASCPCLAGLFRAWARCPCHGSWSRRRLRDKGFYRPIPGLGIPNGFRISVKNGFSPQAPRLRMRNRRIRSQRIWMHTALTAPVTGMRPAISRAGFRSVPSFGKILQCAELFSLREFHSKCQWARPF